MTWLKQTYVYTHLCEFSRPCGLRGRHVRKPLIFEGSWKRSWKGELHGISQHLRRHVSKTTNDCQRLLNGQPPALDTFMHARTCAHTQTHMPPSSSELDNKRCHGLCVVIHKMPNKSSRILSDSVCSHNTVKVAKSSWGESRRVEWKLLVPGSYPASLIRDSEGPTDPRHHFPHVRP